MAENLGFLLPAWIIGAPLALAILELMNVLKEPRETAHVRAAPAPVVSRPD